MGLRTEPCGSGFDLQLCGNSSTKVLEMQLSELTLLVEVYRGIASDIATT